MDFYRTHEVAEKLGYFNAHSFRRALMLNQNAKGKAELEKNQAKWQKLNKNKLSQIENVRFQISKNKWCFRKDEIDKLLKDLK